MNISTVYGGTTFACTAMETVFHDVPFVAGLKRSTSKSWSATVYSQVTPKRDLKLVDLSVTALKKLGIQRGQLIDPEKDEYLNTWSWAEAIHTACPHAGGFCWVSRQDDRAIAIVLFGDRIAAADLSAGGAPQDLLSVAAVYADLIILADRIGVNFVDGNSRFKTTDLARGYAPAQVVRDAREHGAEVRSVCVSASRWDCTLEPIYDDRSTVRLGLRMVRGLANKDGAAIVVARVDRPFETVDDFWRRAGVPSASLVELVDADAMRSSHLRGSCPTSSSHRQGGRGCCKSSGDSNRPGRSRDVPAPAFRGCRD